MNDYTKAIDWLTTVFSAVGDKIRDDAPEAVNQTEKALAYLRNHRDYKVVTLN
jgi:hypothetical protein